MTHVGIKQCNLEKAIERLGVHDHLCLLYETREEQFAALVPFMRTGLERGEKCIYLADDNSAEAVREALVMGGIDAESAVSSGALVIATKQESYLRDGYFDPDRMIEFLGDAIVRAEEEGFAALRATGEMTWALGEEPGVERLMEYESKLNWFFSTHAILAICQYDVGRFPPEVARDAILTHPLVIFRGTVCRNFYYVPPYEFRRPGREAFEVARLLNNLVERERADELLWESEKWLRKLGDLLNESQRVGQIGSWDWDLVNDTVWWSDEYYRIYCLDPGLPTPNYADHLKIYTPESASRLDAAVQRAVEAGEPYTLDLELAVPTLATRWIQARGEAKRDGDGIVRGLRGTAQNITERKRVEAELFGKQMQLKTMAMELVSATERERTRIAGEIHDEIGQMLILCRMKYNALASRFMGGDPCREFAEIDRLLERSIQAVRMLTVQLRPPILATAGLEAALRWLGEELREDYGLEVDVVDDLKPKPLGADVRSVVFQAVRELLLNAAKHAGIRHVHVTLKRCANMLTVTVADDGVGFDPGSAVCRDPKAGGFGLFNVKQRIEHLGGSFAMQSEPGRGTRASVTMPLETDRAEGEFYEKDYRAACRRSSDISGRFAEAPGG